MNKLALLLLTIVISMPAFAYKKGDKIAPEIIQTLELDSDKITIVDFFASWCVSCKKELPLLDTMVLDESKVELLGVSTDKKLEKGLAFQKNLNLRFRIYNDTSQDVVSAFAPFGMPAIYFVKDGEVKEIYFGAIPKIDELVQKDIDKLLAE